MASRHVEDRPVTHHVPRHHGRRHQAGLTGCAGPRRLRCAGSSPGSSGPRACCPVTRAARTVSHLREKLTGRSPRAGVPVLAAHFRRSFGRPASTRPHAYAASGFTGRPRPPARTEASAGVVAALRVTARAAPPARATTAPVARPPHIATLASAEFHSLGCSSVPCSVRLFPGSFVCSHAERRAASVF